jgi:hypothetical protein
MDAAGQFKIPNKDDKDINYFWFMDEGLGLLRRDFYKNIFYRSSVRLRMAARLLESALLGHTTLCYHGRGYRDLLGLGVGALLSSKAIHRERRA